MIRTHGQETKQNDLKGKKDKIVYMVLNYIEQSRSLISTITGCVSISTLASLVCINIGTA